MDRPGGHAEPSHAMELAGAETLTEVTWQEVRQELFSCIQREVRDELNIPLDFQQPPELLGTVINHQAAGRLCNVLHVATQAVDGTAAIELICVFAINPEKQGQRPIRRGRNAPFTPILLYV